MVSDCVLDRLFERPLAIAAEAMTGSAALKMASNANGERRVSTTGSALFIDN